MNTSLHFTIIRHWPYFTETAIITVATTYDTKRSTTRVEFLKPKQKGAVGRQPVHCSIKNLLSKSNEPV